MFISWDYSDDSFISYSLTFPFVLSQSVLLSRIVITVLLEFVCYQQFMKWLCCVNSLAAVQVSSVLALQICYNASCKQIVASVFSTFLKTE